MSAERNTFPDAGHKVVVVCPSCHTKIALAADLPDWSADRLCPVCGQFVPYSPEAGGAGDRLPPQPSKEQRPVTTPAPGTRGGGMTQAQANLLEPAVYALTLADGATLLASVGQDLNGDRWYAATNHVFDPADQPGQTVPCFDWARVHVVTLLYTEEMARVLRQADNGMADRIEAVCDGVIRVNLPRI